VSVPNIGFRRLQPERAEVFATGSRNAVIPGWRPKVSSDWNQSKSSSNNVASGDVPSWSVQQHSRQREATRRQ
jgi:hypothetical protein